MVVAAGVSMYVMYLSNFASLQSTRAPTTASSGLPTCSRRLKRAPERVASEIANLPNVSAIETRVVANVTLDLEQLDEPASGRLISIPVDRRPRVNDLFLRRGRWIEAGRRDEVLASEGFAVAHGLNPGDQVPAVINGRLRRLRIVGIALSPEFVYSIRPGELVPDDKRFGIFWMDRQALGAAFDMEGGFNDVVLRLAPGTPPDETIARLDRILEPYGGLGAIPRALQLSHWTVENELAQLQSFGFMLPVVFLLVAAFILNVALTRALALQRPQIAALKALGYGNRRHRVALPQMGTRHRRARHRDWHRRRRVARAPDHRSLQSVLSLSAAALQRARFRPARRDDADSRGGGRWRVLGRSPRCSGATRGGDAARSAGPLSTLDVRNALGGPPSRRRGTHGAANVTRIRCAPRPRLPASALPSRSS